MVSRKRRRLTPCSVLPSRYDDPTEELCGRYHFHQDSASFRHLSICKTFASGFKLGIWQKPPVKHLNAVEGGEALS